MAYINDLDPEVLYHILCLASGPLAKDIDKWKLKLTLLQVCTKWYDLFKDYVFFQGFVGIYSLRRNENPYINTKSCVFYADGDIVCRSNLGIITGRDKNNCDCVFELGIDIDHKLDIGIDGYILKKLLTLGVGYWLSLTIFSFVFDSQPSPSPNSAQPNLEELAVFASHYIHEFQNRLPNITHLYVSIRKNAVLLTAFRVLLEHYAQRLTHLYSEQPIGLKTLPLFSTKLTHLTISLDNGTHQDLSIHARSLQCLQLKNLSTSSFTWWLFHDFSTPGYIEFTNLKILFLSYNRQTDKERKLSEWYAKQARPYGTHMLQFPKLESLTLLRPPVDCDVLFTDTMPTDLISLSIFGNCSSIVAASRLRITSVDKMKIVVYDGEILSNNLYIAADRYFGYTKIGSTCEAVFYTLIDMQRTVSWINVTKLQLHTYEFVKLLEHISNLYNLRNLRIVNSYLSDESLSIIRLGLEEEAKGEFKLLDTNLELIYLNETKPNNPYNLLAILNHLLLRTKNLNRIETSPEQYAFIEKSFLPEKYPHVEFSAEVE